MKNKFMFLIGATASIIMCAASVNAQNLSVSYNRNNNEIIMSSDIKDTKTYVTVTVKKVDNAEMSKDNLPDFISVFETDESGKLSGKIKMGENVKSGKYVLYNDTDSVHENAEFMIVNLSDEDTVKIIGAINESLKKSDCGELYNVLKTGDNAEKIGVDLSDKYIGDNLMNIANVCYNAGQNTSYTVDTFCNTFEKAIAAAKIVDKDIAVKDVMLKYADCFGTTYEDYAAIEENERNILDGLLKNADYSKSSLESIYSEKCIVAKLKNCKTWSYLKDEILAYYDKIGLDMAAGSDYARIDEDNVYKVYRDMFADISAFTSFDDVKQSFKKAVDNNKSSSTSGSSSGGGYSSGGSGSSKGSGSGSSLPVTGNAVQNVIQNTKKSLSDINNHWGKEYIIRLYNMSVVSGFEDNTFKPDNDITRAEFVKLVVTLFKLESAEKVSFEDIRGDEWYADCVRKAAACRIVNGYDGIFRPLDKITREEVAAVISKFGDRLDLTSGNIDTFSDCGDVSEYAVDAVKKLVGSNIMVGSDNRINPKQSITRAEVCKILCMAYDKLR